MSQQARELNQGGNAGQQAPSDPSGARGHSETAHHGTDDRGHNGAERPVEQEDCAPLQTMVARALDRYFDDLEGDAPCDLYAMVMKEVEKPLLSRVMSYTEGNQSRAAEVLGINRTTLRKKLRQHDLG